MLFNSPFKEVHNDVLHKEQPITNGDERRNSDTQPIITVVEKLSKLEVTNHNGVQSSQLNGLTNSLCNIQDAGAIPTVLIRAASADWCKESLPNYILPGSSKDASISNSDDDFCSWLSLSESSRSENIGDVVDSDEKNIPKLLSDATNVPVIDVPSHHSATNICSADTLNFLENGLMMQSRPKNLPPKDPREEKRHLAAANTMHARAALRARRKHDARMKSEEGILQLQDVWRNEILPTLNNSNAKCSKVRQLCWRGIPPSIRSKVWSILIGNSLNITKGLQTLYKEKSGDLLSALTNKKPFENNKCSSTENQADLIRLDVARTFPSLGLFQKNGPYHETLQQLLASFICYRPDIGYVQGMNLLAAILLLNLDAEDCFPAFANLVNRRCPLALFSMERQEINSYLSLFSKCLSQSLPRLAQHFSKHGFTPDLWLLDWMLPLYAKCLPLDTACRIWDMYLVAGDRFLFRVALGLLRLYEKPLMEKDFVEAANFLTHLPETPIDKLFRSIYNINLSQSKYDRLLAECRKENDLSPDG